MKNFKKILVVMMISLMTISMLVSCGTKATPEESAKIFLDVLLKDDKTNMDKIGLKEEDYTKFKKEKEDELMKGFSSAGVDESILTDEIKTTLKDNIFKGLLSLKYEVTPVSTEKDTAKVNVKISVFDMDKIVKDGQAKIMEKVIANPSMTEKEIYKESFKVIGDAIAAGTVKTEPKTVEITLTKQSNVWLPNDDDIEKIMSSIMGE